MTTVPELARVLLVDDEPHILAALRRQLRNRFAVETAVGGREALARMRDSQPFSVVVSDYCMPEMTGAAFLAAVREASPDTTRVLLTGHADLEEAAAIVNQGGVFRFLVKPVGPEALLAALSAAVEQHRLVTAERDVLNQTLTSAVRALTDLLALASPAVFARASRLRELSRAVVATAGHNVDWHVELATMFSQVGAITLPPPVLARLEQGHLDPDEQAMVERLPLLADELLDGIPRLEPVREAIRRQGEAPTDPSVPLGSRVLRVVHDFDLTERRCGDARRALHLLRSQPEVYDASLVAALERVMDELDHRVTAHVSLRDLVTGMVVAEDIVTESGLKLVPKGQEVSGHLLERLRNFSQLESGVCEPIAVYLPATAEPLDRAS